MDTTSTEELRRFEAGLLNIELTLKVLRKDHLPPEVGVHGSYSKLFVYLCNDQEERVKMIAFGRTADNFSNLFSVNSLVHFTGLETQPPYHANDPNKRYGSLPYELKASAASAAEELEPNYRLKGGMPFSHVKDIDASKPFVRLKLKGKLVGDFVPYLNGLAGQAHLEDKSGKVSVHVQILKVSPEIKTRFRAGRIVVLRGTFRKFTAVTRMVVESDGDVDFENIFGGIAAEQDKDGQLASSVDRSVAKVAPSSSTTTSFLEKSPSCSYSSPRAPVASSTPRRLSEDTFTGSSGYSSMLSFTEPSSSTAPSDWITGTIVDDFTESDLGVWGMLQTLNHEYFEITLSDVPEGAEALFKEGELLSVRAQADQENRVTVSRWCDVRIEGADMFVVPAAEPAEVISMAAELRQLVVCEERCIRAKALNMFIADSEVSVTALVSDTSKVIVKVTVYEVSDALREVNIKETPFFVASGMIHCTGAFCVMHVMYASRLRFESADVPSVAPLGKVIKQENEDSIALFSSSRKGQSLAKNPPTKLKPAQTPNVARKPRSTAKAKGSPKDPSESTSNVVAISTGKPAPKRTNRRKTKEYYSYELVPVKGVDDGVNEVPPKRNCRGRGTLNNTSAASKEAGGNPASCDDNYDDEVLLIQPPNGEDAAGLSDGVGNDKKADNDGSAVTQLGLEESEDDDVA